MKIRKFGPGRPPPQRQDAPHVGLFNHWRDAYNEAAFRADITGRRYRVRFEPNNRWWQITELVTRHRAT